MNADRTKSVLHSSNQELELKKTSSQGIAKSKRSSHSAANKRTPETSFQLSPSSVSSSIAAPTSLTSYASSTPTESPLSPPHVRRFSTNSPLSPPLLKLFRARDAEWPSLPFCRSVSSPDTHHFDNEKCDATHSHPLKDQRQRSKQLMKQWHECRRQIVDDDEPREMKIPTKTIKAPPRSNSVGHKKNPKSKHGTIEYEMTVHSSSVEGTVEAAAWHLHGQSGGRVAPVSKEENPHFGNNVSVTNSKAMSRMKKNHDKAGVRTRDEESACPCDIESGCCEDDNTNVVVDFLEGKTLICSRTLDDNRDAWSTGVASAVVMGTAARYNKSICMFPHGRRVLLPVIMAMMGLSLSIFTSSSCRFMTIQPISSLSEVFQVGPWFYLSMNESQEVCMMYPSNIELDSWFMLARAASGLAVCLGVGLVLWTCTFTCIPYSRQSMNSLGICFFVDSVLQLCTTFFYLSNNCKGGVDDIGNAIGGGYFGGISCSANQDLVFCIAASALYFATGWILYIAQGVIANDPGLSSAEVYTWSALAKSTDLENGMRTVEKSWIRIPDGSTLMATVVVEKTRETSGCIKTTHAIKTEILPAS
ncbi:hypothetical protein HJC23_012958 [Cyclotella cryptica]|uniref:Uncharacterized protein n=1 Tax=Cyclotella cryptica TaxID=29204 RepID=A0ABD3Q4I6_9STRA|eukprot:CCRYP_009305-RA/>CCRYP_009305-RA protein AED:0.00 eAED:0.00 QI:209/-1/1/1/-1/1/1/171/587